MALGTMILQNGKYFDLWNPDPAAIDLGTIAGPLSRICRFGGQCPRFYSVAEHCCYLYDAAEKSPMFERLSRSLRVHFRATCLFHDAAEAFIGDVIRPLKSALWISALRDKDAPAGLAISEDEEIIGSVKEMEARVIGAVFNSLGILSPGAFWRELDELESLLLRVERLSFWKDDGVKWTGETQEVTDSFLEVFGGKETRRFKATGSYLACWSPNDAHGEFLGRAHRVLGELKSL